MALDRFPVFLVLLTSFCCEISTHDTKVTLRPRAQCPGGWFYYSAHCYGFFRYRLHWHDAELDCQSYGNSTHLASIMHAMEGILISTLIRAYPWKENIWLGLHSIGMNNTWKWMDGTDINYNAWNLGGPNNTGEESCVVLLASRGYKFWSNIPCTRHVQYLCKFKI